MMPEALRIVVLSGSLPSYFPERHGVFDRARSQLEALAAAESARLTFLEQVVMDAADTAAALEQARLLAADFVLLLHGGFTMGDVAKTLAESEFRIGFWAVKEPTFIGDIQLNGFVSLNMSLSIARKVRSGAAVPAAWYFGGADESLFLPRLRNTFQALRVLKALEGKRIGRVGGLAPTFYNMEIDQSALGKAWSVAVADFGMDVLRDGASAIDDDRVLAEAAAMAAAAAVDTSREHLWLSARYALAIDALMDREGLDAIAISDWPALQEEPGMHPGAAFSWTEERYGRAIASEGDVMGALSLLAAGAAAGQAGCLLDLCAPDLERGLLLAWHGGGGPLRLKDAAGARWIDHPMLGRGGSAVPPVGAIADFQFADGPVTLFRLGDSGRQMFALDADVVRSQNSGFDGVRGWLANFSHCGISLGLADVIETVMVHGLEHHFVLVRGHLSKVFAEAAAWSGAAWQAPFFESGALMPYPAVVRSDA